MLDAAAKLHAEAIEVQFLHAKHRRGILIDGRSERLCADTFEIAEHAPCSEAAGKDASLLLLGNSVERVLPVVESGTDSHRLRSPRVSSRKN